jgi:hypothetical protein
VFVLRGVHVGAEGIDGSPIQNRGWRRCRCCCSFYLFSESGFQSHARRDPAEAK